MAGFRHRDVERKNNAETAKIAKWLKQGPKVILQAAVTRAHSAVMQSEGMGGRMMHDSSNAAYNWRISVDGSVPGMIWAKGRSPVGNEGDQRTRTGNSFDIMRVVSKRIVEDSKRLNRAIWGSASISKVSLINPVKGYYAINANLDDVVMGNFWMKYADDAANEAYASWMAAGPKVDWSKQSLPMFGGGG